jgi:hypothetical protein
MSLEQPVQTHLSYQCGTPARPIPTPFFERLKTGQITPTKTGQIRSQPNAANSAVAPPAKGAYSTQPVMPVE